MDWTQIITALIAAIAGGGLYKFIEFLISRKDKSNDKFREIENSLARIEAEIKDSKLDRCRLQLLNLMQHNPQNIDTILMVSKKYFVELKGNWYMDSMFIEWAGKQEVELPSWFKGKN